MKGGVAEACPGSKYFSLKIFPGGHAAPPRFHKGKYYPYGSISSSSEKGGLYVYESAIEKMDADN